MTLRPTPGQRAWQQLELGFFCHFGINTFHGEEWSDGTLPAASFHPSELDAGQWVRTAKAAGARYFILTAKHHDGFCLWPTATTDYSVASSPWRDGRGDVVREVADACAAEGMPLGLYLSPWDRNATCYPDAAAYDRFYLAQLRELCSDYGELVELWFDGAGSQGRTYDWESISALIDQLQPQAMVFNMGRPTIRWVGNEDGLAADPVEYVVDRTAFSQYTVETVSLDEALYLPPECDVSIRRGWFWADHDKPKDLDHLLAIHYASIGMGANLLLNVPPDDRGLIPEGDVARLAEWRAELDRRFDTPLDAVLSQQGNHWYADFGREVRIDHVEVAEDYALGQRVTAHQVRSADRVLAAGQTIGHQRLHASKTSRAAPAIRNAFAPVTTDRLEIALTGDAPTLTYVRGYATGVSSVPTIGYLAPTDEPN